ncbi:MAG: transcriptional regulator [Chloroflexota bacterium]|nr:MAG: transcriptional regulator [Chloroflexota bacterium]
MDLHLHTPASADYLQDDVSYLDILRQAAKRGVDIIAITDHNTVAGYRRMKEEIEQLELLKQLDRVLPEEKIRLKEYQKLLKQILVLPGFEFTATFGFHILGIFPPEKPVRDIEHLLLEMNIPSEKLDEGSVTVGASVDVLTAYRLINEAGGMAIAAHANSTHGVAMRHFPFGGQTKIAYTQDINLLALEVTDLEKHGPRTTAAFFNGNKPEYPRRMHCIQGSDAHILVKTPAYEHKLGVAERTTDVRLIDKSFKALRELFESDNFSRTRPHQRASQPTFDFVQKAREEGATFVQDFHEKMTLRGGHLYAIIADVCAFANSNGGTLYIGATNDTKKAVAGVANSKQAIAKLKSEIAKRITPELNCKLEDQQTQGKKIVQIMVPRGDDPPYAVDDNKIYLRTEAETNMAVRDEIVELVYKGMKKNASSSPVPDKIFPTSPVSVDDEEETLSISPPRTGVEVVSVTERDGEKYYVVRDLRNGNEVKNVTLKSSRRLWHYAISSYSKLSQDPAHSDVKWYDNLGLIHHQKRGNQNSYDLIQRTADGYRYYYGVTETGIHGDWEKVIK